MTAAQQADAADFWQERPELAHIARFAHSRMISRWALLGVVLARMACSVPPNVVLPPIIGGDGSLNLFVALVGPSGSGKSAVLAAAADAVEADGFGSAPVGSGEGIARSFAYRRTKDQVMVWQERQMLFIAAEVDGLAALAGRQGATLSGQLRETFNGGELGFGYAAADKRIILPPHSYRASLVVGVQPGRAGHLLDDEAGGTPQRFLWLPATDADVPRRPQPAPERWVPPGLMWPRSPWPSAASNGDEGDGKGIGRREELHVCDEAREDILDAAYLRAAGIGQPLDGHALLCRLKTAAALAALAGRKLVSANDWDLAGVVMDVSNATRAAMADDLRVARAEAARKLGTAEGVRQATAEQIRTELASERIGEQIGRKLRGHGPDGRPWTRSTLRKSFPWRDRETFDDLFLILFGSESNLALVAGDGTDQGAQ